jgi:hypothetical protein
MQNKPNSTKAKINSTPFLTKVYDNQNPFGPAPKQTQSNPIYRGAACAEMIYNLQSDEDYKS